MKNRWLAVTILVCGYLALDGEPPLNYIAWGILVAIMLWFWPHKRRPCFIGHFYFAPSRG